MAYRKSNSSADARRALMTLASAFRDARAARPADVLPAWECAGGHEWDDTVSASRNVRCMSCAAQRREAHLARFGDFARARGGELLSERYVDASTPLRWQCAHGHTWDATAGEVEQRWCVECVRQKRYEDALADETADT
jgi:hypothetical protein